MENKYFKYKEKYLNLKKQIGGVAVPKELPATQSWLYMPIILRPFMNINVFFNSTFDRTIEQYNNDNNDNKLLNLNIINQKLTKFYIHKKINLDNHINLYTHYMSDSDLHLNGNEQERLLKESNLAPIIESLVILFIANNVPGNVAVNVGVLHVGLNVFISEV